MPTLNSIRARLTAAFMLVTCAVVVATIFLLICYSYFTGVRAVDNLLRNARRDAVQALADSQHPTTLREWLREHTVWLDAADMAAVLIGPDGSVEQKTQPSVPSWPRTADGWKANVVKAHGETLVIGYPWWRTEAVLRSQAILLALLGLFLILVTGAASWALVGQTLLPIRQLSRQAQAASTDRLRLSLVAPTRDVEVAELVTTLNGLLARLADTASARGRFYAAASHELRTPLQALTGHLELALNREREASEYRALLEEARVQAERLTILTRDVLFLNRLEIGSLPASQPVELSELCERMFTHFQGLAARRQLSTRISLAEEAVTHAPPVHVEILTRNLIENAVKYATHGGTVTVSLVESEGRPCLEVFNSFPAEPKLDREALFEPFFRPDVSRNMETGGNGLGLAICGALTAANGWGFDWRHDADGVRATVLVPERA